MSKLLLAFGTVTASLALSHASPADARGGHFGGFSFGGGAFSAHRTVAPNLFQPKVQPVIKPVRVRDNDSHRVVTSSIKTQDHVRRVHVDKPVHEKVLSKPVVVSKPVQAVAAGAALTALKTSHVNHNQPLSSAQLLKAKLDDGKGRKYDAANKTWWDGKHWWHGRFAWLYVDDTWYYGNSVWRETNGTWNGDDIAEMPVCVDCRQVASAPVRPRIETAVVEAPAKDDAVPQVKRKPKVEPKIVAPVEVAAVAPVTTTTTTAVPSVAASVMPPADEAVTEPVMNERECRKFLPQLGMAVTVPCAD